VNLTDKTLNNAKKWLTYFLSGLIFITSNLFYVSNAAQSVSLTTISTTWNGTSYASAVAELKYISESQSDIFQVNFVLKSAPSGAQTKLQLMGSSATNATLNVINPSSLSVVPNTNSQSSVSTYIKVQLCDIKNGCSGNLSVLGTYAVSVVATDNKGVSTIADLTITVNALNPNIFVCRDAIDSAHQRNDSVWNLIKTWENNWSSYEVLSSFLSSNNLVLNGALDYQSSLIDSEVKDANWRLSLFQGNIKNSCASTDFYSEWGIESTNFISLISKLNSLYPNFSKTWQELIVKYPSKLLPTRIQIEAPASVTVGSDGIANFSVTAWATPEDLKQLPIGRSSLEDSVVYKGSCGYLNGENIGVTEKVITSKPGYSFFVLDFKIKITGNCQGQFRYYGNSKFDRSDGFFNVTINPKSTADDYAITQVSAYSLEVVAGSVATIYYWVNMPFAQGTGGLGAGIGEFGSEVGAFGPDYPSVGWTLGFVKGESPLNGLYKSNINIPSSAEPGIYKTWVFWKGLVGPVYGPDIKILSNKDLLQNDLKKSCENQSSATSTSLKNNSIQISELSNRISKLQNLESDQKNTEIETIKIELKNIDSNLVTWLEKLPYYLKTNPTCKTYEALIVASKDLQSKLINLNTQLEKFSKTSNQINEDIDDGVEVEPEAQLSITKKSNGSYIIKVDTNLESEDIEIFATKKGAKTIKYVKNTGVNTQITLNTSRNLKGYSITVKFNGEVLKRISVLK
jgi:hypothetical protein